MKIRKQYNHGDLLERKSATDAEIGKIYKLYLAFLTQISSIKINSPATIKDFVEEFNLYRSSVLYIIENRKNSGQEILRSSMLEELFCHLFSDLIDSVFSEIPINHHIGRAKGYVDLTFSPSSFKGIFTNPNPYIHTKDQDFILGAVFTLIVKSKIDTEISENIIVPVLAIECKTYLERNMLDSCSGTARRLKSAMPYCLYIVVAEYMKLKNEQPELTDINEIYILSKASNSEREQAKKAGRQPHDIQVDLIEDLFNKVKGHLNSIWWSPDKALTTGKIINRP